MFGVTGWKNAGKTTLVERLVAEFVRRGWRVATIKHAHHAVDIDQPGTDSFRHRAAGATEVALVGGRRYAIMREQEEPTLAEVLARLAPADLMLIEGFKRELASQDRGAVGDGDTAADGRGQGHNIVAIAADSRPPVSACRGLRVTTSPASPTSSRGCVSADRRRRRRPCSRRPGSRNCRPGRRPHPSARKRTRRSRCPTGFRH